MVELGEGLMRRELALAADAVAQGRALAIVLNKLDALSQRQREDAQALVHAAVRAHLPEVRRSARGQCVRAQSSSAG